jgi:hypothetical protein
LAGWGGAVAPLGRESKLDSGSIGSTHAHDIILSPARIAEMSRQEARALLPGLSALHAQVVLRASEAAPVEDSLLTLTEAARLAKVSASFLVKRRETLPFARKIGTVLRFQRLGLLAWKEQRSGNEKIR